MRSAKKLKTELDRMEKLRVIEKVTEPTEWVNSLVIVEKSNGNVRVCLDPRNLINIEDVAVELNGATFFSTIDASSGFWQVNSPFVTI